MAQRGGRRPGAGRKPGKVSAAKRELAGMARGHAEAALQTLVDIATGGESEAARVSAATAILDRGYGRPMQQHELTGREGGPIAIQRIERVIVDPDDTDASRVPPAAETGEI